MPGCDLGVEQLEAAARGEPAARADRRACQPRERRTRALGRLAHGRHAPTVTRPLDAEPDADERDHVMRPEPDDLVGAARACPVAQVEGPGPRVVEPHAVVAAEPAPVTRARDHVRPAGPERNPPPPVPHRAPHVHAPRPWYTVLP